MLHSSCLLFSCFIVKLPTIFQVASILKLLNDKRTQTADVADFKEMYEMHYLKKMQRFDYFPCLNEWFDLKVTSLIWLDAPVSAAECQREVRVVCEHKLHNNYQLHAASNQHQDVHAGAGWAAEEARQRDGQLQRSSGEHFCHPDRGGEISL